MVKYKVIWPKTYQNSKALPDAHYLETGTMFVNGIIV